MLCAASITKDGKSKQQVRQASLIKRLECFWQVVCEHDQKSFYQEKRNFFFPSYNNSTAIVHKCYSSVSRSSVISQMIPAHNLIRCVAQGLIFEGSEHPLRFRVGQRTSEQQDVWLLKEKKKTQQT